MVELSLMLLSLLSLCLVVWKRKHFPKEDEGELEEEEVVVEVVVVAALCPQQPDITHLSCTHRISSPSPQHSSQVTTA